MKNKLISAIVISSLLAACAIQYPEYNSDKIDSITDVNVPEKGKAGIYIYRDSVFLGMIYNTATASFKLKGYEPIEIETKNYLHLQIEPGKHAYRFTEASDSRFEEIHFKAGNNYFYKAECIRAYCDFWFQRTQSDVDEAKKEINSKKYTEIYPTLKKSLKTN